MPHRYPKEFRDDVVRIVLYRGSGVSIAQIARDFGIHVASLDKWLRKDRIETGQQPGVTRSENAKLRDTYDFFTNIFDLAADNGVVNFE